MENERSEMRTNSLKPFFALLFYLLIFPVFLFSNDFEPMGKCTAGPLRIRSAPDLSGQILGRLEMGDEFDVLGRTSYKETIGSDRAFWYKIRYQDLTGYVFGSFIEIEVEVEDHWQYEDEGYDSMWIRKVLKNILYDRNLYWNKGYYTIKNAELTFFDTDQTTKINGDIVILSQDLENRRFLIQNEEFECGWIDIDTAVFENYIEIGGLVRNGPMTSFSNELGHIEFFDKRGEEFTTNHDIIDIILEKYVMVYSHYYESYEYRIFDLSNNNEERYDIWSRSHYSPDGNLFFCGSNDDLAGYYGFDLFSIADGELTLLLSHKLSPSSSYSATQIVSQKWVGNDEVILESEEGPHQQFIETESGDYEIVQIEEGLKYRIIKTESGWEFKDPRP